MKHLFTLILCLASVCTMHAQSVSLFNIDASGFPTVKAKFYAFDAANKQQRPSKSELTITENGQPRTITSVTCPPDTIKSLSVCIMVDTYGYGLIKLAQAGTQRLINYLLPPKDEIAITIMDKGVQIHQDFTSNMAKAKAATLTIPEAKGVDIQSMFYHPYSGGVPFISNRATDKKTLVLISDLHCPNLNLDKAQLFQDAAAQNISVYTILLGTNDYSGLFTQVATQTGGKVFEYVKSETEITNIFDEIERREHNIPCDISWIGQAGCGLKSNVVMEWQSQRSTASYPLLNSEIAYLHVRPNSIIFGNILPKPTKDTTITITAVNTDFEIQGINQIIGLPLYSVVNVSFPLLIPKNTSKDITLRYSPTDSNISFATFEITTNLCSANFSTSGGDINQGIKVPTLKVLRPNGGEKYVAGGDSIITWEGVSPSDTVQIEYSIDNGSSWKVLTTKGVGLKYVWKNIPRPESFECKIKVTLLNSTTNSTYQSRKPGTIQYNLTAHYNPVKGVCWSPDGSKFITGGDNVIIWDPTSGLNLLSMEGGRGDMNTLSWSPDGSKIAGINDLDVKVWDALTGNIIYTLKFHSKTITSLRWNFDGTKLVSAAQDNSPVVWDITTGKVWRQFYSKSTVTLAEWSPDGTKIVTTCYDNTANVWDVSTGTIITTLTGHSSQISSVSWSKDGRTIATVGANLAIIWDAVSGARIHTLTGHSNSISKVMWSPDDTKIATCGIDSTIRIWNTQSGATIFVLKATSYWIFDVCWSFDGNKLASTSTDGRSYIWDAVTGTLLFTLSAHTEVVWGIRWSRDDTKVVTVSDDRSAIVWDALTGKIIYKLKGHEGTANSVSWSPDGSRIASLSSNPQVILWDASSGNFITTLQGHSNIVYGKWSPDGKKFATASWDKTAIIWDAFKGTILFTLSGHTGVIESICWSPDGTKVVTGSHDNTAIIWDVRTGVKLFTLLGHTSWVRMVSWNSDGSTILTTGLDNSLIVWDATTGKQLYSKPSIQCYQCVSWSPDGTKLAVGISGTTLICNSKDGTQIRTFNASGGFIHWSPDSRRVTDAGSIIEVSTGNITTKLADYYSYISTIRWSPDGTKLAVIGDPWGAVFNTLTGAILYDLKDQFHGSIPSRIFNDVHWSPDGRRIATAGSPKFQSVLTWNIIIDPAIQEDESDAVFSIIEPKPTLQNLDINMGKVLVGDTKDTTIQAIICNTGSVPLHVLGIEVSSGDVKDFSIPRGAGDFYLGSNECRDVMFGFNPNAVGNRSAAATIRTTIQDFTDRIKIIGQGVEPPLSLTTQNVDFGKINVGRARDSFQVLTIKNVGGSTVKITNTDFQSTGKTSFSAISGLVSFDLLPNETYKMDLRFLPNNVGRTSGFLRFHYNGVGSPSQVQLFGEGLFNSFDTARTTVIAQDITAQAGEKVNLSLKLLKSMGMQVTGAPTDWYARIHYNKSILFNEHSNNVCPGTTDSCVLELTGVYNPKTDELISLPCIATLGNTDHSSIVIDEFKWTNSGIVTDIATQNGTITITGTCEDGGVRLFIPAQNSTSLATRPNPAQDKLQIQYGLREPLTVTLELLTMTGQVVQTIVNNQAQAAGQYTLTNDLHLLGNGVYLLRLRTNKDMLTTRVDVVK